jgi:hypothetical protein
MGSNTSKPGQDTLVETETFDITNPSDGFAIPCKLWKPNTGRRPRAAVFLIHGGIFTLGCRETHAELIQAFVKQLNILIVTASFRDGKTTTYETGKTMSDLMSVANFMIDDSSKHSKNNKKYNNNNNHNMHQLPFGLIGCSSGGFFAMALANKLGGESSSNHPAADNNKLRFCIPICPVSNPHARAMYLRHCLEKTPPLGSGKDLYPVRHTPERAREILNKQLQFFETYKQMSVAAQEVDRNLHDVPTLAILGAEDKNVPPQVTEHVSSHWCWRLIVVGKGAGHEIQAVPPSDPRMSYIPDMNTFLVGVLHEGATGGSLWCSYW